MLSLWQLGIRDVMANVVFEDVWESGDDYILETQLKELADHCIETGLYKDYNCTFFSKAIGNPLTPDDLLRN